MRNAKRHNHYGRSRRLRAWATYGCRLALVAAFVGSAASLSQSTGYAPGGSWLALATVTAQDDPEQAGRKNGADAKRPAAYCFDVALPITDAVEKSVTRRVERAIRQFVPEGRGGGGRPIIVFEFRPA